MFNQAIALHQAGRLDEAEHIYRQILATQPGHFPALHFLGVIHAQRGDNLEAVRLIDLALKIDPRSAMAINNRAKALQDLGRYDEALAGYDTAIAIKPDYAEAINNRGNALQFLKRYDEALASYDKAVSVKPDYAQALFNRGRVEQDLGRLDAALASYGRAIAVKPDYARAYNNSGVVLHDLERYGEAIAAFDRAVAINTKYPEALNNRGNALLALRRHSEALSSFDAALAINPGYADVYNNRGNCLQELNRFSEAVSCYDRALAIRPDHADAHNNRGNALQGLRRYDEALLSFGEALRLNPQDASAHANSGRMLARMGRYEEGAADLRKALAIAPDHPYALGDLVHFLMTICAWDDLPDLCARLIADVGAGKRASTPFPLVFIPSSPATQKTCATIYASDRYPAQPALTGPRSTHDKIRVAYVSADFCAHATAFLIAELFERHDTGKFEFFAVSLGASDASPIRKRMEAAFDNFIDASLKSDREIAELIHGLGIDIAVDLKGFTQDGRAGIFAYRSAPIQVAYLGFPGTSGADFIDYIIADPYVIPDEAGQFFSEKIVRLPDAYQVNDTKRGIAEPMPTRRDAGLPDEGFVFCSFNNSYKFTPELFDVWMRLLRDVEGSVLWLYITTDAAKKNLAKEALARGVSPDRLIFAAPMVLEDHLSRIRLADLFLDAFPCNAHTTASDALWAGVPLVTCSGDTFASRVAGSLLNAVGLPELVTHSVEDYRALALKLAHDPALLGDIRAKLARNRMTLPLFDIGRFARHLESAYVTMIERHRNGDGPTDFAVSPID